MERFHLDEFFTYETTLQRGIGFGMFRVGHFIWLAVIFAGIYLVMRWYRRADKRTQRKIEIVTAASMSVWIVIRVIYIAVLHENFLYELPLHLCSMAGILCGIHCITQWEWLGQVLYSLCLPGAVLALLFPNWNFYPAIHFLSVEAFLFHMGILLYVFLMLWSHKIVPDVKKAGHVVLFMFAVVVPIYFFDKRYDVNYMFVNRPSAGSPLVWLAGWMGDPGYLVGYAILMILCVVLMDLGYLCHVRMRADTIIK